MCQRGNGKPDYYLDETPMHWNSAFLNLANLGNAMSSVQLAEQYSAPATTLPAI